MCYFPNYHQFHLGNFLKKSIIKYARFLSDSAILDWFWESEKFSIFNWMFWKVQFINCVNVLISDLEKGYIFHQLLFHLYATSSFEIKVSSDCPKNLILMFFKIKMVPQQNRLKQGYTAQLNKTNTLEIQCKHYFIHWAKNIVWFFSKFAIWIILTQNISKLSIFKLDNK